MKNVTPDKPAEETVTEFLVVTGAELVESSATDRARVYRDKLLFRASKGIEIKTAELATRAAQFLTELKTFERNVEDARKAAKAPLLQKERELDALANELTTAIASESLRISRMLGTFQQEQKRLEADAARKRWEDEQAIIRQAEADVAEIKRKAAAKQAEIDQQNAEAQRLLDEKSNRARSDASRARIAEEKAAADKKAVDDKLAADNKARELVDAHRDRVEQTIVEKRVESASLVVAKPAGISTSDEIIFEVDDIVKLYESNPAFVELTPQKAAIKNALKLLSPGQTLPGVRHWMQPKATVRSARG